jgi:hypothetical protein
MQRKLFLIGAGLCMLMAIVIIIVPACKKESVPPFELIGPDYTIEELKYDIDNDELNEFSNVDFSITIKNLGLSDSLGTYLYIFRDGRFLKDIEIVGLKSNESDVLNFLWEASPGMHAFEFKIDITPADESYLEENNEDNNTAETVLEVVLVEPDILTQEEVEVEVFLEEVSQEDTLVVSVYETLESEGLSTSEDGTFIKTEFDRDGLVSFTMSLHNPDGSVDESKILQVVTFQNEDGEDVAMPMITEVIDEDSFIMYDSYGGIVVSDGGNTVTPYENPMFKEDCSEPWFWTCVGAVGLGGIACVASAIAAIPTGGAALVAAIASCGATAVAAIACAEALVDNDPELDIYDVRNGPTCTRCEGDQLITYTYDGLGCNFSDDRGLESTSGDSYTPGCSGGQFTFSATDCGGNTVSETRSTNYRQLSSVYSEECHDQGGN